MPQLRELGERFLIKYVLERIGVCDELVLPGGDDAAAFWFNGLLVTCVDMLVWETDVPPTMSWRQAGWKAVVSAVSDAAAKGARPKYLLLSLALNPSTDFEQFQDLIEGAVEAAQTYNARIIGGDLNEHSLNTASVTVLAHAERIVGRNGARPGDLLATTGLFGKTYAALHAIINQRPAEPDVLESVYRPEARVEEGVALATSGGVSACLDSSDGLAESIYLLSESSGVGFLIDKLPLDSSAEKYCLKNGINPFDAVFYGGEEYELVFTVKRGWEDVVADSLLRTGRRLHVIGRAIEQQTIKFLEDGVERSIERRGWQHFNQTRKLP
ncbi:MAG: thiamine-phosphate kinase [Candidatus Caldarchaeum sp.]